MYRKRRISGLTGILLGWLLSTTLAAADIKALTDRAETGNSRQVLQELVSYLRENPDDYPAMFLQGRLQEKHGDMQAAIHTYQQLIKQQPSRPEAYNNLAALYAGQGDYEQAQALLEQAMQTHPSYATVYENLSQVYVEKARNSYGKALQLDAGKNAMALRELKTVPASAIMASTQTTATSTTIAAAPSTSVAPPLVDKPINQASVQANPQTATQLDKEAIITTLQGWAAAWSEQVVDVYLIFYADEYAPEGMSRANWEQERRERLLKPQWIKIDLSDFQIKPLTNGEARVEMVQEYRASNYQDKTKKRLQMRQTPDGWRIVAEQSIAKLN